MEGILQIKVAWVQDVYFWHNVNSLCAVAFVAQALVI